MGRRLAVDLDEQLSDALRRAAVEDKTTEEQVVADALRRYFGLRGLAVLDEIAERQTDRPPSDDEAIALAVDELRAFRTEQQQARGA